MIPRPASLKDVPALAALGRDSFTASFGHLYRPEDLDAFLSEVHAETVVAEEVAADEFTHALVVEGDALAGYCKLRHPSPFAGYSDAANPIALSQLYTAPASTGRGIGAALMDWTLAEARARGCDAVQLSVWSGNLRAQKFYARYHFIKIADIHFPVGEQLDEEFLLELRL